MSLSSVRPRGVTVLSVVWLLAALANLASGSLGALLPSSALLDLGPVGTLMKRLAGGLLILALVQIVTGVGLWFLRPWARPFAIAFALAGLVNFPIGTLLGLVALTYLFRPTIRDAFAGGEGEPAAEGAARAG